MSKEDHTMLENLGKIARNAAQKFGDREALIFEDTPYTYNQLNDMVEKVAGGLESIGIEKDNVVTLEAANQNYDPIKINADLVEIQGKLLAVWRKV